MATTASPSLPRNYSFPPPHPSFTRATSLPKTLSLPNRRFALTYRLNQNSKQRTGGIVRCEATEVSPSSSVASPGRNWVPVVPLSALPKGERRVIIQDDETILLLWYKNDVFAIENRSPAEGAYSEGLLNAKLTQDGCIFFFLRGERELIVTKLTFFLNNMSKSGREEDVRSSSSQSMVEKTLEVAKASVFGERKEKEMKKETRLGISAKKDEDFPSWYSQVCRFGELITLSDTKGLYILEPSATKIWNTLRSYMDAELEKLGGVEEKKFPMLIKRDSLEKEKDHIEGFKPEVAWVTRAGEHDLPTPYALRPTSETIIYPYFKNRIRTHRDLPMKVNQWVNVVRWEVSDPIPLIRGREFDWQEGHSAFATKEEADEEVLEVLNIYSRVYEDLLAVPVIKGRKSDKEKFAGADYTTSVEAFIPTTGRGVQAATSHCLGQNFAKMFEIAFEDKEVKRDKKGKIIKPMVWQNSWGLSTRSIGVMAMTHGDEKGLVLPPKVARHQVVVIPVPFKGADTKRISQECQAVKATLQGAGVRVIVDEQENYACGWKYADWEMKGVPLRIELGPRDLEKNQVRVVRRDTGAKMDVLRVDLVEKVKDLLEVIQRDLYDVAKRKLEECIHKVETWDEFKEALRLKKLVLAPWCDEVEVENDVKENTKGENEAGAKTLCTPFDQPELREDTLCFASGKPAKKWTYWGRSY